MHVFFIIVVSRGQLGWKTFSVEDAAKGSEKYRKKCIRVFLVIFWTLVIWITFSTQLVTCFTRNKVN